MIITTALLALTPSALATPPPFIQLQVQKAGYDWQSQITKIEGGQKADGPRPMLGSLNGSRSYVGQNLVIDDWNND